MRIHTVTRPLQLTHMVLAVGATDGCAVYMAKNIMHTAPQIKHALILQVHSRVACQRVRYVVRDAWAQGSLSSADDLALKGFSTIFASSPQLYRQALDMARDGNAEIVPAWSLPKVEDGDASCSGGGAGCVPRGFGDADVADTAFYFDAYPAASAASAAGTSSSALLSVCFANEHFPHPLEQLQPCLDADAHAVVILRLPLLVVDAVSMALAQEDGHETARASEVGAPGAFRATAEDLARAEAHCAAVSEAAARNGLYM